MKFDIFIIFDIFIKFDIFIEFDIFMKYDIFIKFFSKGQIHWFCKGKSPLRAPLFGAKMWGKPFFTEPP